MTLACATPTRFHPEGRAGTDAGYQAHQKGGEAPCGPCQEAHFAKCHDYWVGLSPEEREQNRANMRQYAAAYRERHVDRVKTASRLFMADNRQIIRDAKDRPCADCGGSYPYYVMQFDHIGSKTFNIGQVGPSASRERLFDEIARCEVVCANCHAERTFQRRAAPAEADAG